MPKKQWVALPVQFSIASSTSSNQSKEKVSASGSSSNNNINKKPISTSRVSSTVTSPEHTKKTVATGTAGTNTIATTGQQTKKVAQNKEVENVKDASKNLASGERRRSLSMPSTPGHNPAAAPYTPSTLPQTSAKTKQASGSKSSTQSNASTSGGRKGRSQYQNASIGAENVPTYRYDPNSYDEAFLAQCVLAQV